MSKHIEKYPGLYAGAKAAGINYMTALQRVHRGSTVEQALSTPVNKCGRKPKVPLAEREARYLAVWMNKAPPGLAFASLGAARRMGTHADHSQAATQSTSRRQGYRAASYTADPHRVLCRVRQDRKPQYRTAIQIEGLRR